VAHRLPRQRSALQTIAAVTESSRRLRSGTRSSDGASETVSASEREAGCHPRARHRWRRHSRPLELAVPLAAPRFGC